MIERLQLFFARRKNVVFSVCILSLFSVIFGVALIDMRFNAIERYEKTPLDQTSTLYGVQLLFNTIQGTNISIHAEEVQRRSDQPHRFTLRKILATFTDGNEEQVVTAPLGELNIKGQMLSLKKDVTLRDSHGGISHARHASFDFSKRQLVLKDSNQTWLRDIVMEAEQLVVDDVNKTITTTGPTLLTFGGTPNTEKSP